jgi:hypothetical protein
MSDRRRFQPDPKEDRKVVYNPMTGGRRDLEVEKEDGAAAGTTHARWVAKRRFYLETLIADVATSDEARARYTRELAAMGG